MVVIISMEAYEEAMDNSLIQELEKEGDVMGVPVCGANLWSPVYDRTTFIGEVHYRIGTRLYIKMQTRYNGKRTIEPTNVILC